ncbi:MAG: metallophosphoesterase family protein [Bacteroidota bacterium]
MENTFRRIICLSVLLAVFSSCERFEMRGFIMSYESADRRFEQSMEWNARHPYKEINVSNEEYSIFAMGDSHVGTTKNLDRFFDEATAAGAVAAVMAGDITDGHPEDYNLFSRHLPAVDSLNYFMITGNHDLYFDGWKQFYSLFGSSTYIFTVRTPQATDLFICTDTGGGTLGKDQLEWLKNILKNERPGCRHCFLFTHNNLFRIRHTTSTNPPVEELHVLMDLCVRHNIDMVVAGHDHKKNVVKFAGTTHITMDALKDGYEDAGYLVLDIGPDSAAYEFVQLR